MKLSPLILQGREEALREGEQSGIRAKRCATIENLLRFRFGIVDDQLSTIIEPVLELPPEEFIGLLLQLSREELLTRFGRRFN